MQELAKQFIRIMTQGNSISQALPFKSFNDFLFDRLYSMEYIKSAYGSEEEAINHFMSGEVTVPFVDVLKYAAEYMSKRTILPPGQEPPIESTGWYAERDLVEFGNYLLHRYNVMVHSNDGSNQPIYERMVSHADICNWQAEQKQIYLTSGVENLRQVEGMYQMLCKVRNVDVEMHTDGTHINFYYNNALSKQMKRSELELLPLTELADVVTSNFDQVVTDQKLPSRFQNGDKVEVNFGDAGRIGNCEIIKVHFTESKVLYDVKTSWKLEGGGKAETRFYNVDSAFVESAENS